MKHAPRLVPRFDKESYGPGDAVTGAIEVTEPVENLRRLDAYLKYVDRSQNMSGAETFDAAEPLHEGPVQVGDRIPFELHLPPDALPNREEPEVGELAWSIVTEADIESGLDKTTTHSIPVDESASWTGPEPGGEPGEVKESGAGWDLTMEPDRWSLRRGESVNVMIGLEKPSADRDEIELGLMCQADHLVEYRNSDRELRQERRAKTVYEDWPGFDPALPRQEVTFEIPADAPFSYEGKAFGYRWFVVARERRKFRSDPTRSARLRVLP